jgi:hypothetical protein
MRYIAVLCTLLASMAGAASAADMTHEETVVRTFYAKFAYAVQQGAIGRLALEENPGGGRPVPKEKAGMTSDQRLAAAQVSFILTDFVIGDVREILNKKAIDLISPAVGETLRTSGINESYSDMGLGTHWNGLEASWRSANPPPIGAQEVTIRDLYQVQWHEERPEALWQLYASYTVTVSFQGKSRGPYKALFIFGHDAKGDEVVEPEDATTDPTGLVQSTHDSLFPDAFVLTRLRTLPVVASWLNANQMSGPNCSVGRGDVCCDLSKMKCGPAREDVAAGLSKSLPDGLLLKP